MKKLVIVVIALFFSSFTFAQSLLLAEGEYLIFKNYEKAYGDIEKVLKGKDSSKVEGWLLKHKICMAITINKDLKLKYPGIISEGASALYKAYSMPNSNAVFQKEGFTTLWLDFITYYTFFANDGYTSLNKNNYKESFNHFNNANEIHKFLFDNKQKANILDTFIVLYAGYSAMKENDDVSAFKFYQQIVDQSISNIDAQQAYSWLAEYNLKKLKNIAKASAICKIGEIFYPNNNSIKTLSKKLKQFKTNKDSALYYEEKLKSGSKILNDYVGYSNFMGQNIFVDSIYNDSDIVVQTKNLYDILGEAIKLYPNSKELNTAIGNCHVRELFALVKRQSHLVTDSATKSNFYKQILNYSENAYYFLNNAVLLYEAILYRTNTENSTYKIIIKLIIDIFNLNNDKQGSEFWKKKLAALN